MRAAPAKFSAPQPVRTHMTRARLAAPVIAASGFRLVSVHAPAGFGKTGAMLDIRAACEAAGIRTAWVQLGAADNDFPMFLASLDMAVDLLERPGDRAGDPTARHDTAALTDTVVERLARLAEPFAIFLDDFETLQSRAALAFLRELLGQVPDHGRFVVGSRGLPDLGIARLRAHGRLLEIDADALRFTLDETRTYLETCVETRVETAGGQGGQPVRRVSATDLHRLHRRTEGWVVALWLAVLAMQRCDDVSRFIASFSGSDVAVADYLAEDVLSRQPAEVQDFLHKTALLSPFCVALCNAVTQRSDSAQMLERLSHDNLFLVSVDGAGQWYRYHSLFADFLQSRLALHHDAAQVGALHRRASEWYVAQCRPVPAIEHALRGGDTGSAIDLLQQHAGPLLRQGRVRLLARWFDALPAGSLANRPGLRLVHAWALTFLHRSDMALALLDGMRDDGERDAEMAAHMLALRAFILALTDRLDQAHAAWLDCARKLSPQHVFPYGIQLNSLASCHIYLGEFEQARRLLDASLKAYAEIGGSSNRRVAQCLDGSIDLAQGRLQQALARYRGAHEPDARGRAARVDGQEIAGAFLAEALYEAGRFPEAQRLLAAYQPLIQEAAYIDPIIVTFVLLCRMALAEARDADGRNAAMLWLHDCEQMGYRTGLLRMVASARLERARIALLLGERERAQAELAGAQALNAWSFGASFTPHANDAETLDLGRWRLAVAAGDVQALALARRELGNALDQARRAGRGRRALKLRIVLALAEQAAGDRDAASASIAIALEEAEGEGFVSTFTDEGSGVATLLQGIVGGAVPSVSERARQWAGQLLAMPVWPLPHRERAAIAGAGDGDGAQQAVPLASAHGLTGRELSVLRLLAEGLSNKGMADRLFVSETTIKTHLRNINGKLDASSRTHAVAVARRLGLVA